MIEDQKTRSGTPSADEPEHEESNHGQSNDDRDASPRNPTRYGDWEVGGRCIDF